MIATRYLLREAARCIQAGPSLASKWRRFHYAPLSLWARRPRQAALFVAVRPYTMLPYGRMERLYGLAEQCNREKIPGAFVQCGVWKGGSAAVLADQAERSARRLFLFDSFQGCPPPGPNDVSVHGRRGEIGEATASQWDVEGLLMRLGICPYDACACERWLHVVPGCLEETLPIVEGRIGRIALLHLDVDWYKSTKVCMEYLYDRVTSGGFIYADDYGYWPAVKQAVQEYFWRRNKPMPVVQWGDHTGVWWRKGCS